MASDLTAEFTEANKELVRAAEAFYQAFTDNRSGRMHLEIETRAQVEAFERMHQAAEGMRRLCP